MKTPRGVNRSDVYSLSIHGLELHFGRPTTLGVGLETFLIEGELLAPGTAKALELICSAPQPAISMQQRQISNGIHSTMWSPIAKSRGNVLLQQIRRLHDVHVTVQYFETLFSQLSVLLAF